jgi:hypothetical protein
MHKEGTPEQQMAMIKKSKRMFAASKRGSSCLHRCIATRDKSKSSSATKNKQLPQRHETLECARAECGDIVAVEVSVWCDSPSRAAKDGNWMYACACHRQTQGQLDNQTHRVPHIRRIIAPKTLSQQTVATSRSRMHRRMRPLAL